MNISISIKLIPIQKMSIKNYMNIKTYFDNYTSKTNYDYKFSSNILYKNQIFNIYYSNKNHLCFLKLIL